MIKSRKIIVIASFLFLGISISNGQTLPIDPETKKVQFQETVTLDSLTQGDLYDRSVTWMTNFFKTNKFDVNDKVNYKLVNEGNFPVSFTYDFKYKSNNTVTYNITLDLKDGKYRYTMTDFKIYDVKLGPKTAQTLEVYFQKMKTASKGQFVTNYNNEVNLIIEDMKKLMLTGTVGTKDDW